MGPRSPSLDELLADSRSIGVSHFFEIALAVPNHAEDPVPVIDVPECAMDLLDGLTPYGS